MTTASKEPEEIWTTPAAISVLTQEDIRRSGLTSIPELLRLVPGVEVARSDSNHWAVGIRGFGGQFSRSVLVLIDGRSVYTPLFAGVYWDIQNLMLEDVERIEVIRGPGGTIWGANAVNGVINIITKKAKDTHGTLASLGGGNMDQGTGAYRYGGENGSKFDYRLYAMGFVRGAEYHSDHDLYDNWRDGQLGFRADWTNGDRDSFTAQGDIYKGASGEKVGIATFAPPEQTWLQGDDAVSGGNLLLSWKRDLRDGSDVQVQAYYDRTSRFAPHYGEVRDTFDIDFVHQLHVRGRQNIIWGLGGRVSPSQFTQKIPTLDFEPRFSPDTILSGFVQDEIQLIPRKLALTAGIKLEHNTYSGFEYQPSVRLIWSVRPKQALWAAVSRAVRTPSRLDNALDLKGFLVPAPPEPIYLEIAGDPKFASERLLGFEAGYRTLMTQRLYTDVSWFHNEYSNLVSYGAAQISLQTSPINYILLAFPYINGIKGSTDGFEIAPDWKPVSWWQLKGSYAYLHLDLRDMPGVLDTSTVASYLGSSPHHQIVLQSQFNLPHGFEIDETYRFVSALPAQSVKKYSTADLRIGWRVARQLEISLAGENLLEPFHYEFSSSPGPIVGIQRSVYLKITWTNEPR